MVLKNHPGEKQLVTWLNGIDYEFPVGVVALSAISEGFLHEGTVIKADI